jgi:hypothetical protein
MSWLDRHIKNYLIFDEKWGLYDELRDLVYYKYKNKKKLLKREDKIIHRLCELFPLTDTIIFDILVDNLSISKKNKQILINLTIDQFTNYGLEKILESLRPNSNEYNKVLTHLTMKKLLCED